MYNSISDYHEKKSYFHLLEYFYCALEELNLPIPCGFFTHFGNIGVDILSKRMLIQYVNHDMFCVTNSFIDLVKKKYDDSHLLNLLFRKLHHKLTDESIIQKIDPSKEIEMEIDVLKSKNENIPYFLEHCHSTMIKISEKLSPRPKKGIIKIQSTNCEELSPLKSFLKSMDNLEIKDESPEVKELLKKKQFLELHVENVLKQNTPHLV